MYAIAIALNVSEAWLMGYDDVSMERDAPVVIYDSGREDEFAKLFQKLTTEQQSLIIAQIKGILSNQ